MGIEYRRKIVKRGNSYSVTIPHEFLWALEGDPSDYEAVWSFDSKVMKPTLEFRKN